MGMDIDNGHQSSPFHQDIQQGVDMIVDLQVLQAPKALSHSFHCSNDEFFDILVHNLSLQILCHMCNFHLLLQFKTGNILDGIILV